MRRSSLKNLTLRVVHPGIRGKILACFLIMLIFFLVLILIMQTESMKVSKEYSENLSNYLLVHRFRLNLTAFHAQADRYLKDPLSTNVEDVYRGIISLNMQHGELVPLENVSIPIEFEVRATGYGLDAYLPLVSRAIGLRSGRSSDYYAIFVKATRIQGYIDIYLNRMLTALMKSGEETYALLLKKSEMLNRTILLSVIFISIIALVVIIVVTEAITAPLRRLAKEAEKLSRGNLDAGIVEAHTKDEVETLTRSFAAMAASIKEMVEGLKEKAELERLLHEEELALVSMGKALREAQFMNLQEQMKPHFLFNALNTIARSALLEDASRTESLAMGLASLLRAALKETGSLVSLEDEISLAQAYLEFQHARFGDRLLWRIDVPDTLRSAKIPRLMMQLLVENAVRHAIEPKLDGGAVYIKTREKNRRLLIWILDNGTGMSSERLEEIKARIAASLEQKSLAGLDAVSQSNDKSLGGIGIGLANLATRLGILYPSQCRFEIYSRAGRGTLVKVAIPYGEGAL